MLQIKNISKTYKTGDLVQKALNDVSLNLRDNEFVAILGPSGSGKTTLLNIIGGLDRYDSGDLIINNISTKKYKDRDWDSYRNHTIGFVFQSYNLIPHQNVLSNVELALTISGVSAKERKKRALDALEKVGLKEQAYKKPNQMSGGQMQRVAIARALVNNPSILLADEPTGALDTKTSIQVMDLLKEVAKDRLVVMVTHNPELAEQYANRIVKLKDGVITDDSNPYNPVSGEAAKPVNKNMGKAKMGYFTALSLSFNNLLTKKGRTILTAFAGSVGIIGIALILALSTGFQNYIDQIQEDTMSSYPLTIQKETTNVFGALLSYHMEDDEETSDDDTVQEQMLIQTMMNSVGSNDLKSFKAWLEDNQDEYKDDVNKISYSYSVSPLIYTKDVTDSYVQLNPNTLMSSIYSDSASSLLSSISSSSSIGTFSEVETDELQEDCELLAGTWPTKYNEVMVVLSDKNKISDLLVYSLGLRDTSELKTLITDVMAGEESDIHNEPMTFTYEDLMNVQLKLINPSDLYKYNSKYDTYEDMSEDEDYVKDVYDDSEDLKIVCVAYTTDSNSSIAGVVYSHALVEHVIDVASNSEIVKKQLANKNIDVFSGNEFDDDSDESGIDFNDMVSIDEDKLKDAFKVNINTNDFVNLLKTSDIMSAAESAAKQVVTDQVTSSITTAATGITNGITALNASMLSNMITSYENCLVPGTSYYAYLDTTNNTLALATTSVSGGSVTTTKNYEQFIDKAVTAATYKAALAEAAKYDASTASLVSMLTDSDYENLTNALKKSFIAYYDELYTAKNDDDTSKYGITDGKVSIVSNLIDSKYVISQYGSGNTISKAVLTSTAATNSSALSYETTVINRIMSNTLNQLVYGGSAISAATEGGTVLKGLSSMFSGDIMSIDTDKFAEAFNFDMDEDELTRIMTSMMTGSSASYSNNLTSLGYQDEDDPTTISIYFNDFDSKENFLDLLDSYNDSVDEEKEIQYTDITGMLISSVQTIVNAVTYVLIAFVSISLIVSSIMIAVITLISVMERTKEIGILRAMGASKHNVSSIFNAETFIIGLLSGTLGVVISWALTFPINNLIHKLTDINDINAVLSLKPAIILVLISVFLTMIAGFIPSKKAAKQDPVVALRTE